MLGGEWMVKGSLAVSLVSTALGFDAGRTGFTARYHGETSAYRINAVFLMPGETLDIEALPPAACTLAVPEGSARLVRPGVWTWQAPRTAGLYRLRLTREDAADTMRFNAFVMVPAPPDDEEYLEGYHIGKYPRDPLKGMAYYRTPKGYIRVDAGTAGALVSPHLRLGQFVCKQSPGFPAYMVLKERLVLKLETVLERVNERGIHCDTFHVMSGYRTPFYNHLIGNVKFSAHQWGGASDIFIDEDKDGSMDDLNGDGKSDGKDSEILFDIVDKMSVNEFYLPFLGGVGKYNRNESHGPFVHMDVRGFRAVW